MSPVSLSEVRAAVVQALGPDVADVVSEPHLYASTHRLDELHVRLQDGRTVELLLKELGGERAERENRPAFLVDPGREGRVYRSVLAGRRLGPPDLIASGGDGASGSSWLVLERVAGVPLWQVGELDVWCDVAAWAGRLHTELSGVDAFERAGLVRYDRAFFARWPTRARALTARAPTPDAADRLAAVLKGYDGVLDALAALPVSIVHGELYASNVMVVPSSGRIGAIDWELAGVGTGLLDLACLVAGRWDDAARHALVEAYHGALPRTGRPSPTELARALWMAELHLCVQWLGWDRRTEPPPDHAQDWLAKAERAVAQLRKER